MAEMTDKGASISVMMPYEAPGGTMEPMSRTMEVLEGIEMADTELTEDVYAWDAETTG